MLLWRQLQTSPTTLYSDPGSAQPWQRAMEDVIPVCRDRLVREGCRREGQRFLPFFITTVIIIIMDFQEVQRISSPGPSSRAHYGSMRLDEKLLGWVERGEA